MSKAVVVKVPDGFDVLYEGRVYPFTYKESAEDVARRIENGSNIIEYLTSYKIGAEPEGCFKHGTEAEAAQTTQA